MVTIKAAHLRESERGNYVSLELVGDPELVQSSNTGRFYATQRRCFVSATFDIDTAQMMLRKQMPGIIERVECEPYEYTLPETGEVIMMGHRYDYAPEQKVAAPAAFAMA